jgi:RHS repeat-associated protein
MRSRLFHFGKLAVHWSLCISLSLPSPDSYNQGLQPALADLWASVLLFAKAVVAYQLRPTSPASVISVGTLEGKFRVNEVGAAHYDVPIETPPGTGGVKPELSFVYDSRADDGLLGMGWAVAGLSAIERCPSTIAQHGHIRGVSLDDNDQLCMDGQLLVAVQGQYGSDGTVYRTENEAFTKVISNGTNGKGPLSFDAWTKSGIKMQYGRTADSLVKAPGTDVPYVWAVNKIEDTLGNYMSVAYDNSATNGEYYPIRLLYTGNSNAGLLPYNSIEFQYEDRPDIISRYLAGSLLKSTKRLSTINVKSSTGTVREYRLKYDLSTASSRSRLLSIAMCDGTGNCLPASQFDWIDGTATSFSGVRSTLPWDLGNPSRWTTITGDFNGDGKTDYARLGRSDSRIFLSRGDGTFDASVQNYPPGWDFGLPSNWQTITGDFNGDGLTDYARLGATDARVFLSNGDGTFRVVTFNYPPTWNFGLDNKWEAISGDFNGDGRTDFARLGANSIYVFLSNGDGTFTPSIQNYPAGWDFGNPSNWKTITGDFNGDGLTDYIRLGPTYAHVFLSNGNGTFQALVEQYPAGWNFGWDDRFEPITGDFNGDGRMDFARLGPNNMYVFLSKGDGHFAASTQSFPNGWNFAPNWKWKTVVGDFNRDGRTDFARVGEGYAHLFISNGDGTFAMPVYQYPPGWTFPMLLVAQGAFNLGTATWSDIVVGDFDGDGRIDFARLGNNLAYTFLANQGTKTTDVISGITNGYGAQIKITYKVVTDPDVYEREHDASYPFVDTVLPFFVVSSHGSSDGLAGFSNFTHKYGGLKAHLLGRGLSGFHWHSEEEELTRIKVSTYYLQEHPFQTLVSKMEKTFDANKLLFRVENEWGVKTHTTAWTRSRSGRDMMLIRAASSSSKALTAIAAPNAKGITYFPYLQKSTSTQFDLDGSFISRKTSQTETDDFGNVTVLNSEDDDGNSSTTTSSYENDTDNWLLGRLKHARAVLRATNHSPQTRESEFEYELGSGLLKTEASNPGTVYAIRKEYFRDAYGNIIKSVTSGLNSESRITSSEYDRTGRFSTRVVNAMGQEEKKDFDESFGAVTKVSGPNRLDSLFQYDSFGRETKYTKSTGAERTQRFIICPAAQKPLLATHCLESTVSGTHAVIAYLDILDRTIRRESSGWMGRRVFVDTEYNEHGLVQRISDPYYDGDAPVWTSYEYDILGRTTKTTLTNGGQMRAYFRGRKVKVRTAADSEYSNLFDGEGRIVESKDGSGGALTFSYDANGNLSRVKDDNGNVTESRFDFLGRKVLTRDPDMGMSRYEYDLFGNVTKETNALGQQFRMKYDLLDRVIERDDAEGTSTWTYDKGAGAVGKLTSIEGPDGYKEEYEYDDHGRPSEKRVTIDGQVRSIKTTFDQYGRESEVKYPTDLSIRYQYDEWGYLVSVLDFKGKAYWKADGLNARGAVEREEFGNGLITERAYDSETGRSTGIFTKSPTGTAIQKLKFRFDTVGNLKERSDELAGTDEEFEYDSLNRLTTEHVNGQVFRQTAYDTLGNISYKSDVGKYLYGENGAGPHAVTSLVTLHKKLKYRYDLAGDLVRRNHLELSYTTYGQPREIESDKGRTHLFYGPSGNLYKKETKGRGIFSWRTSTIFLGPLYEEVRKRGQTTFVHYISGRDGIVACDLRDDKGGGQTLYVHKDYLGSAESVTNQSGMVVEKGKFDAWGSRITGPDKTTKPVFGVGYDRGFEGHDELDDGLLVRMGTRLYDPHLAKFLNPDPFTQFQHSTQGWNRYSYVLNNPLSFQDPSGFFLEGVWDWISNNWKTLVAIAAAIAVAYLTCGLGSGLSAAIISGALAGATYAATLTALNGGSLGDVIGAALLGALAGALSGAAYFGVGELFAEGAEFGSVAFGEKVLAHGVVGGAMEIGEGGAFEHGFWSAALTESFAPAIDNIDADTTGISAYRAAAAAIIGGTAEALGGGKFADGAITGAFSRMFNDDLHFNGRQVTWTDDDGIQTGSWDARSGHLEMGLSLEDQMMAGKGPLPEGDYMVYPANIQHFDESSVVNQTPLLNSVYDKWTTVQGKDVGVWRGTTERWGDVRVKLDPMPGTNTLARGNFYFHGGNGYGIGSGGCVKFPVLHSTFFDQFESYGKPMHFEVQYPH